MKTITVKDLLIPLKDYATVSEDATLGEAVTALEKAQQSLDQEQYKHRAVLIRDRQGQVVGKLSQLDVLRALEPKNWEKTGGLEGLEDRFGLSTEHLKSRLGKYAPWDKPLRDICRKAWDIKVKHIMYTPSEGEFVDEDATLDEAINQLIMGRHQSLLVLSGKNITGVLRLSDVFMEISKSIQACKIPEGKS